MSLLKTGSVFIVDTVIEAVKRALREKGNEGFAKELCYNNMSVYDEYGCCIFERYVDQTTGKFKMVWFSLQRPENIVEQPGQINLYFNYLVGTVPIDVAEKSPFVQRGFVVSNARSADRIERTFNVPYGSITLVHKGRITEEANLLVEFLMIGNFPTPCSVD